MAHVREIARSPHPPGTPEHDRVRDYLVAQCRKLGFATRLQRHTVHRDGGRGTHLVGTVENVVAEKTGTAPTGTLLLAAHYDSHGTGPGAADDAAGVAALLEAARALGSGANTLRLLITDGEESGLFGAQAYVDALAPKSPSLVLNFEARGGGGPVFMFETSDGNLPLIRAFAQAAPRPHASSLMYALYRTLPNDTDLTVFKKAGMAGLNFAFVGRWQHYHTLLDTPEGLDQRSLQQQGATALALGRRFLAADLAALTRTGRGEAIYFDLLGRWVLFYPVALAWPLTALALAAFAALLWRLRKAGGDRRGFLAGLGLGAGTLAFGALAAAGLGLLVQPFRLAVPHQDPYGVRWFEAALLLAVLALTVLTWEWALRRLAARPVAAGALAWWLLALVAATAYLPGATYLLLWPLLFALPGLWWQRPWLGVLPLVLLFPPLWHSLALLLGFGLPSFLGALAAFGLLPLLPLLPRMLPARAGLAPACLAGAGALCFAAGALQTGPRVSTLLHLEHAETGRAQWVSLQKPDAWTRPLLGAAPGTTRILGRTAYTAEAAPLRQPPPEITRRGAHIAITLPERALALTLELESPVQGAFLEGQPLPPTRRVLWTAPPQALSLRLEAPPGTRLTVDMILPGLPSGAPPRPAGLIPAPAGLLTDVRIVRQVVTL